MSKRMKSKKEQDDDKKKADEEAAARAYEDFYKTFVEVPDHKSGQVWVKAGTFDAGSRKEDTKEKGKLYKPTSKLEELRDKFSSAEKAAQYATGGRHSDKPDRPGKKKEKEKKKSNLELFKEELKVMQEERAERHRVKAVFTTREPSRSSRFEAPEPKSAPVGISDAAAVDEKGGSYDSGDPNTTNLYLGNLSPKITEQKLMELFGRFGPLASIKIMWPRTDDERNRGRNCGFVAFMNRRDGERCLAYLNGRDIDGFEMKLGWGKSVPIPPNPIYIPPILLELTLPPPPSGLPFNAQPDKRDLDKIPNAIGNSAPIDPERLSLMEKILQRAVVKVVIPTERNLLQLIHRMIEFVIREGPLFEAMIMSREIDNPDFRFLFENQSPAHVYYRWKLNSVLHGESPSRWETKPFRMFKGGSIWKPPPLNPFLQGMPDELIKKNLEQDFDDKNKKGSLSDSQRNRLEILLRGITPERQKVGETMVWCIDHAEAAEEICQCISESMCSIDTALPKKIGRLYLVSDILHNCSVKVANASFFRKYLQQNLLDIAEGLHVSFANIESRIRAEHVKQRVMHCFRAWEDWAIYPHDFLITLQNIFMGIITRQESRGMDIEESNSRLTPRADDVDGIPIDDVDGFPLGGDRSVNGGGPPDANASLLKNSAAISALMGYNDDEEEEDIDGAPMDDDIDGIPMDNSPHKNSSNPGFLPSKWESVSPKRVESQAMTLSKWDELEGNKSPNQSGSDSTPVYNQSASQQPMKNLRKMEDEEDLDGIPMEYDDFRRRKSNSTDKSFNQSDSEDDSRGYDRLQGDSEERRAKLRAVEIKVLQYQDELEKGIRPVKSGYTMQRQTQHYRHKLMRKIDRMDDNRKRVHRSRSSSPEDPRRSHKKQRRTSRSPSRSSRRHTRSPVKKHHSKSPQRKHRKKSSRR